MVCFLSFIVSVDASFVISRNRNIEMFSASALLYWYTLPAKPILWNTYISPPLGKVQDGLHPRSQNQNEILETDMSHKRPVFLLLNNS